MPSSNGGTPPPERYALEMKENPGCFLDELIENIENIEPAKNEGDMKK